jgi:hypothetical protein
LINSDLLNGNDNDNDGWGLSFVVVVSRCATAEAAAVIVSPSFFILFELNLDRDDDIGGGGNGRPKGTSASASVRQRRGFFSIIASILPQPIQQTSYYDKRSQRYVIGEQPALSSSSVSPNCCRDQRYPQSPLPPSVSQLLSPSLAPPNAFASLPLLTSELLAN